MGLIQNIMRALYNMLPKASIVHKIKSADKEKVRVHEWLKKQLTDNKELLEQILVQNNLISINEDTTAVWILRWVQRNIKYVRDIDQYKQTEYWATVDETLTTREGDCEDGAALVFCLCRTAGIPAEQISFTAGSVKGGGHSWVRYISKQYPYVSHYLDWCYWYESGLIRNRSSFIEKNGKVIIPSNSKYYNYWFMANDESGFIW